MFVLLITENGSINTVLSQMAHVIWVKDVKKAMSLATDEEYDDILISEPFNKNKELLDYLDSNNLRYILLNEINDLKKYIQDKKAQKNPKSEHQPSGNAAGKTYSQESVLLVTTNQKTIQELCGFNLSIATTPYSASQHIQNNEYRLIVWDLPVEPLKTSQLLYVWGRDLKTTEELDFVLRHGHLRVSSPNQTPEPMTRVVIVPETKNEDEQTPATEINVEPIKNELKALQQLKQPITEKAISNDTAAVKPKEKKVLFSKKEPEPRPKSKPQKKDILPERPKTKASFFTKTGVIVNNTFMKLKFNDPDEIDFDYDALVITASMGTQLIKDYRRKNPLRPVVVLNGDKSFLEVGADKLAKRINKQIIDEMTHLNERIKKLWMQMETDSLTGVYTRAFFEKWKEDRESRGKGYSIVLIDIDKFKAVNDTYGHDAGDLVLHQFAQFLKNSVRAQDLVVRWGGEEFIVALPDTNVKQSYVVIDRLREIWSRRAISMPNGEIYKGTFSAGVAQYKGPGHDVIKEADELLYMAKNSGRNKVLPVTSSKIAILGNIPAVQFLEKGYQIMTDYREADCIVADINAVMSFPADIIPPGITLYILGKGKPSDLKVKRLFPSAFLYKDIESIISAIEGDPVKVNIQKAEMPEKPAELAPVAKPNITVLPGVRANKNNLTIPKGGVIFVVSPSRPGIASELAAKLASAIDNTALVCAAPESSAALNLGVNPMTLIEADWRFPRSIAPIQHLGIYIWPVDPYKYTGSVTPYDVHRLVEQIKHKFNLVIVDCCGSLSYCSRVAHDEAIMVIKKEGDSSDAVTEQWLTNYKGQNVLEVSPIQTPSITEVGNGLLINTKALNYKEQYN